MSINKLWLGNSPIIAGASTLVANAELYVHEGYYTPINFESGYRFRREISVGASANTQGGTLVNFPMLFSGTYDFMRGASYGGNIYTGFDYRFEDTGGNVLPHELESYDNTTGAITAWVQVPAIGASSNASLYLYYGNSAISSSQQGVSALWGQNYVIVSHMTDATTSSVSDSSRYGNNGTKGAANLPLESAGLINKAQDFAGNTNIITHNFSSTLAFAGNSPITISAWYRPDTAGSTHGRIVTQTNEILLRRTTFGTAELILNTFSTNDRASGGTIPLNEWSYITGSYGGASGSLTVYINGLSVASVFPTGTYGGIPTNFVMNGASPESLNGMVDEFRIQNIGRSENWLRAEYNNQISPESFYDVKGEQAGTGVSFTYADIGKVFIDNISHEINGNIGIRASNSNKKLRNDVLGEVTNYDSSYLFTSTCKDENINENWQQSSSTYTMGGSVILGASSNDQEMLVHTGKGDLRNFYAQARLYSDVDAGIMYIGGRNDQVTLVGNSDSSCVYTYLDLPNNNIVQQRVSAGNAANLLGASYNLTAANSYWLRFIGINDMFYTMISENGYDFVWAGSTRGRTTFDGQRGSVFIGNQRNSMIADDIQVFTYDKIEDVGSVIKDLAYKANIPNVHIPADYTTDFSSGFTSLNGTWGVSTNGVLTGIGTSINTVGSRRYASYFTGASFQDFNLSVEVNLGSSTYAGVMFGLSGNQFNAFTLTGLSTNSVESNYVLLPGLNEHIGASSYRTNFPVLFDYPYINTWTKLGIVKNDDRIRFLVNDLVVYSYTGRSAYNVDSNNVLGLVMGDPQNAGVTPTAMFRNFRVDALSNVLNDFELQESTTSDNGIDRLTDINDFHYLMSGLTMRVIAKLESTESSAKLIGVSAFNWDNSISLPDGLINHVIVQGDNIKADAWDDVLFRKLGSVERLKVINDQSLKTYSDCLTAAQKILDNQTKILLGYSMVQKAYVDLEVHDVINRNDSEMGISQNLRITDFTKRMSVGSFTQNIDFSNP